MTRRAHVSVRTLPSLMEIANGLVRASDLRELDIEDLLGRDAVPPDAQLLGKNIRDKVVLVTGAGGSIGSELCRQIVKLSPKKLLLIEASEFALYAVHQELTQLLSANNSHRTELIPLLASVLDADRMGNILRAWHPHTIYHAAAYKHVPMVEHNPIEGVRNNVLGTLTLARAAATCGVGDFVLISTDKAVRPTNVMGASKRLAEMLLQALAESQTKQVNQPVKTRFSMVRFGNVLGSSGSVVPLFRKQIKSGGPLTLTHPGITRYFMTLAEASQLVIQAGAMAKGGDVFVLDMGEPIRIHDLAKSMVELSGLSVRDDNSPNGDIEIQITGLRPGEKLYEELLIGDNPLPSIHPRIMTARDPFLPLADLMPRLETLKLALDSGNVVKLRSQLQALVPGYQPEGAVVDWVHLANVALSADIAHLVHEVSLPQTPESANEARLQRAKKPASVAVAPTARQERPDDINLKRLG
jgi:FlaA1/EpsC-like NDP-sugar epimerase